MAQRYIGQEVNLLPGHLAYIDLANRPISSANPQWGGPGTISGRFEEPVGLALDTGSDLAAGSNLSVADTWNRRIQVFDGSGTFLHLWPVEAWYGESVVNKPYLAVDGQGRVYVADTDRHRILKFHPLP